MDLLDDILLGDAVYWAPTGTDSYGRTTFAEPIPLKVRWVDQEVEIVSARGETRMSKATVFVRQDLNIDGALWKGKLADLTSESDPFANPGAWQIQLISNVPTIDYDDVLRVVTL